ncbi:hypothetical protein FKM82_004171 [Ascaphus truei]
MNTLESLLVIEGLDPSSVNKGQAAVSSSCTLLAAPPPQGSDYLQETCSLADLQNPYNSWCLERREVG